ncbi:MAG: hypothetical protein ACI8XZ_004273 [Gammaproteobacteria bacterium]|jgi:hypothetical protein
MSWSTSRVVRSQTLSEVANFIRQTARAGNDRVCDRISRHDRIDFRHLAIRPLVASKTQLNYAAFESARSGSLNNARRGALNDGVVRGPAPIHPHGNSRQWLRWARSKVWDEIDAGRVEVQIIDPTQESFTRHGYFEDTDDGPIQIIPKDHLMYRDSTPSGTPSQSIQDANLLKIRVMYCAERHVPFVNRMINSLLRLAAPTAATACDHLAAGPLARRPHLSISARNP